MDQDYTQHIGDGAAFQQLLRKYLKPVYGFVFQFVKDRAAAEDIAQDAFTKAWKNLKKFDQKKSFKTWLFAIAKNSAYDYLKKKKAVPFSSFADEAGNNQLENIADGEAKLEEKLEKLPEHYKIILILHYKEDFSLQEITEILGAPYNTVKSHHARVLRVLKKIIFGKIVPPIVFRRLSA